MAGPEPLLDPFLGAMETLDDAEIETRLQALRGRGDEVLASLRERYRDSSPSDLHLRWRLVVIAAELRDPRALELLAEALDTETKNCLENMDMNVEGAPSHGMGSNTERVVIMMAAIDGVGYLVDAERPQAREVLFRTVLGHPFAGVRRAAAMAFIRTSSSKEAARKELADALPPADQDIANVTEKPGTEL